MKILKTILVSIICFAICVSTIAGFTFYYIHPYSVQPTSYDVSYSDSYFNIVPGHTYNLYNGYNGYFEGYYTYIDTNGFIKTNWNTIAFPIGVGNQLIVTRRSTYEVRILDLSILSKGQLKQVPLTFIE